MAVKSASMDAVVSRLSAVRMCPPKACVSLWYVVLSRQGLRGPKVYDGGREYFAFERLVERRAGAPLPEQAVFRHLRPRNAKVSETTSGETQAPVFIRLRLNNLCASQVEVDRLNPEP